MTQNEWTNIQDAIIWLFWPIITWWAAALVATGFLAAVYHVWLGFLKYITRKGGL
jgi:hypothetical protein